MLKAGSTGMDPASVVACGWAAAGIPKRGAKGTSPAKSCRGYMRAKQSSDELAWRVVENFLMKAWCFHPPLLLLHSSVQKCCPCVPIEGQWLWWHGMLWHQ